MSFVPYCVVLGVLLGAEGDVASTQPAIQARVDPRVELMCVIFRLAGNPEYNHRLSKSAYADEVEKHFGIFRNHPVVETARQLRAKRGVSYDAVMSMAVHIEDAKDLKEKVPFEKAERLDGRWRPEAAREFLVQARQFVKDTKFGSFIEDHQDLYKAAAERMAKKVNERDYRAWFDSFFGAKSEVKFSLVAGMLTGGNNYGVGIRYPDGREEISPVLGVTRFDEKGIPVFKNLSASLVVHEFCHSYTNPLVDKHLKELEPAGKRLFAYCGQKMKKLAYSNWQTMMRESLVRACQVRYKRATEGRIAAWQEALYHQGRGFSWTNELAQVLREYETQRDKHKTLDAFMPKIVAFFNEYAEGFEAKTPKAPKVVSMVPKHGATDVDPQLKEIKVTFDRSMKDKAWSVVGGGPHFPKIAGEVSYDTSRKVFTIPVKLKRAWRYECWLNRGKYTAFQSEDGVPLESVHVEFRTRAE